MVALLLLLFFVVFDREAGQVGCVNRKQICQKLHSLALVRSVKRSNQTPREEIRVKDRRFCCWFRPISIPFLLLFDTEADKGQSQNILKPENIHCILYRNGFWKSSLNNNYLSNYKSTNQIIGFTNNFVQIRSLFANRTLCSKR